MPGFVHMTLLHLHLLSDSTGETLEMVANASLAQFDDAEVIRHFWPMVRSLQHLDRIVEELSAHPGLVLYTLVKDDTRRRQKCPAAIAAPLKKTCGAYGILSGWRLHAVMRSFGGVLVFVLVSTDIL